MAADSYESSNSRADLSLRKTGRTHPLLPGKALLLIILTLIIASMAKIRLAGATPSTETGSQALEILSHLSDVLLIPDLLHLNLEHLSSQQQFEAKPIFPPELCFSPSLGGLGDISRSSRTSRKAQGELWGLEATSLFPHLPPAWGQTLPKPREMLQNETNASAGPGWGIRRNTWCCLLWPGRTGSCKKN